jgi:predicted membrane-bound spermidine synthase
MAVFRHRWQANLVVFISNVCIMTLELVAGRLLAPTIGVSLYTWTSIIGVILAGISLGNYIGGKLADRIASSRTLTILFWLAGVASLAVLYLNQQIGDITWPELVPLWARIVLITGFVFFLPSVALGTISPMVIKLTLVDLGHTGEVVGQIYASASAGSILGTFATGFVLISWLGTRVIVAGVAAVLLIMGLLISLGKGRRVGPMVQVLLIGLLTFGTLKSGWLRSPCWDETNYFCIKVREQYVEGAPVKVLTLDRLVHSYVDTANPRHLVYGYELIYADVLSVVMEKAQPSAFFIGGGGYTFPRYMEAIYPGSRITVVEIDPGVTQVAHEELGLPRDTPIVSYNQDARDYLMHDHDGRYDLVVGDAFNDFSVPYHLTTLEFNQMVKAHLNPDGIYMVNLIDGRLSLFLRAYVSTLQKSFAHVYVASTVSDNPTVIIRQTYVIVATDRELTLSSETSTIGGPSALPMNFWTRDHLAEILQQEPASILRDDYVPVDNLLAPVFADSSL